MNDQWKTIQRVFEKARLLEGREREQYLEGLHMTRAMRQELDSLLAQHDRSQSLLGLHSTLAGRAVSHFTVGERLGEGGMALVYKAFDQKLHRGVALKVLPPWAMGNPQFRERLLREARHASAVSHPNIVTVYEINEENGVLFVAMELLPGKTLNQVIQPMGLPLQEALHYAAQIADGLGAAHAAGIVHGDLKPLNVMIDEAGRLKLLDFGLAQALTKGSRARSKVPSEPYGTKTYMAPELLARADRLRNEQSDIFSFGMLVHEMLGGAHAFGAGTRLDIVQAILKKPPTPLPPTVPVAVQALVFRCLEKKPSQRFVSVAEARSELAAVYSVRVRPQRPIGAAAEMGVFSTSGLRTLASVQALLDRIGYENVSDSHEALAEIEQLLNDAPELAIRQTVSSGLKRLIVHKQSDGRPIRQSTRDVRKQAFDVLRKATAGHLRQAFGRHDFEQLDLYGFNFASADLGGTSFGGAFLVEATFAGSNLADAVFADAYIRNVDFSKATLDGADFTNADWFNTLNLTEEQLASVRPETLLDCPRNVAAMHAFLENRYGFPFDSWDSHVQDQLRARWNVYLRANGFYPRAGGSHRR